MKDFTDEFRESIIEHNGLVDEISTRRCRSDTHDGIEYEISGEHVPIRPIIAVIADEDKYLIDALSHNERPNESFLTVFVAEVDTGVEVFVE